VLRWIAGVRGSDAPAHTLREYTRVIPVLAGQIREAASRVEDTVAEYSETVQRMHVRGVEQARGSTEAAACIEDAIGALKLISLRVDQGTPIGAGIRDLIAELEPTLTRAMTNLRQQAEAAAASPDEDTRTAVRAIDLPGQRLHDVIDTLSEMQDEFVAALERPDERVERPESAAVRLRQRYTAAEARR
jgi:hypothetical protein